MMCLLAPHTHIIHTPPPQMLSGVLSMTTCLLNVAGNAARMYTTCILTQARGGEGKEGGHGESGVEGGIYTTCILSCSRR